MRKMAVSTAILLLSIAFLTIVNAAQTETIVVPPLSQREFIFNLDQGDTVRGSISVSGGSGNDVDFWVTDPEGSHVLNFGRVSRGTEFSFSADRTGAYSLHFGNSFSLISSKTVTITYTWEKPIVPGLGTGPADWSFIILVVIVVVIIVAVAAAAVALLRRKRPAALTERGFATPEIRTDTGPIYCANCGVENPRDRSFCFKCGQRLYKGEPL